MTILERLEEVRRTEWFIVLEVRSQNQEPSRCLNERTLRPRFQLRHFPKLVITYSDFLSVLSYYIKVIVVKIGVLLSYFCTYGLPLTFSVKFFNNKRKNQK